MTDFICKGGVALLRYTKLSVTIFTLSKQCKSFTNDRVINQMPNGWLIN